MLVCSRNEEQPDEPSATPMYELEDSATYHVGEKSVEALLVTTEGVQAETRETVEPLTVSAVLQTREKQFDFLESLKVHEEVYADEPAR